MSYSSVCRSISPLRVTISEPYVTRFPVWPPLCESEGTNIKVTLLSGLWHVTDDCAGILCHLPFREDTEDMEEDTEEDTDAHQNWSSDPHKDTEDGLGFFSKRNIDV